MEGMVYDSSGNGSGSRGGDGGGGSQQQQQQSQRTKRMRTSFKHHQLRTMKSYFAINQNPDAKDLKQLAQKTGLSKRVLQVLSNLWCNNKTLKFTKIFEYKKRSGSRTPERNGVGILWDTKMAAVEWAEPADRRLRSKMATVSWQGRPRRRLSSSSTAGTNTTSTTSHITSIILSSSSSSSHRRSSTAFPHHWASSLRPEAPEVWTAVTRSTLRPYPMKTRAPI